MKIAALQPFSLSDFPPYCAAIIFTIGCNLRCPYCHNKMLWDEAHPTITDQSVLEFLQKRQNKIDGVVITGGEPTIQDDLEPFIKKIKNLGYKIKLNTNGTNPNKLRNLLEDNLLDYIAMDIKSPLHDYQHQRQTIFFPDSIKESIKLIASWNIEHEFRTIFDSEWLKESDIEVIKNLLPKNSNLTVRTNSSF